MCSTSGLLSLGLAILLAALVGVLVVWLESRSERKAWRTRKDDTYSEEYCADKGADR